MKENLHLASYNFPSPAPTLKLEMSIFVICNRNANETIPNSIQYQGLSVRYVGVVGSFFMFSNFYQLYIHIETCVTSTNVGLKIKPPMISEVHVCRFLNGIHNFLQPIKSCK
jgi:hypothetical protein